VRKNALRLGDFVDLWGQPLQFSPPDGALAFYWPVEQALAFGEAEQAAQPTSSLTLQQVEIIDRFFK
jgi:hypothetical protein